METPLDQETATADRVTDTRARHRCSPIGDEPTDDADLLPQGLTSAEDDELRRLHWLSRMGVLAVRKVERLIELRLRDRRTEVREPREFVAEQSSTPTATALSGATDDLVEVRRQLESMAHLRLILPFDDDQRESYRELLATERLLIERSKRSKDADEG